MNHAPLPVRRLVTLGQALALAAVPAGGQAAARRNAWRGMSHNAALGRARREAEAAMEMARDLAVAATADRRADQRARAR